ncbi:MAG TPA: FAD-dependent oxidoreductase [Stellaceae bacterium]|jgi:2-polyprenyl-6-methoxyphenol hydroxylase-like FAD-dependent oxidoreductase|nr:FAD-dependent oxidoreductase [Stellaceae bacterium]
MADGELSVRCCIAGGGPAGMMLGLLLARAGVPVLVLEKHADFLRDFRGDTIHPSTLEIMHELGLLAEFLRRPHQEARSLGAQIGEDFLEVADFTHLPTHCRFLALMPQWDFLDFVAEQGRRYPSFRLMTRAEVTGLVEERGRISGVRVETPQGHLTVRADLVVGADGRHSTVRRQAGLAIDDLGAPMDVLWMRLSRRPDDPAQTLGRIDAGRVLVMLNREDYWQCAYVIAKGGYAEVQQRGLPAFRDEIARLAPYLRDRTDELRDWDDVRLLSVAVDRLRIWHRPGLLCIGDAAHAMSPIGGVGINLAIQDAVAAANILAQPLLRGVVSPDDLSAVQRRRQFPTKATQALQVLVQNRVIRRVLGARRTIRAPLLLRLLSRWRYLRRFPARIVGLGFRPEHVKTPARA